MAHARNDEKLQQEVASGRPPQPQQILDACDLQGAELWQVSIHPAMPRLGRRQTAVVVLRDRDGWFRFTEHYEGDDEFGQGRYRLTSTEAMDLYIERVKRYRHDWRIHEDPSVWEH